MSDCYQRHFVDRRQSPARPVPTVNADAVPDTATTAEFRLPKIVPSMVRSSVDPVSVRSQHSSSLHVSLPSVGQQRHHTTCMTRSQCTPLRTGKLTGSTFRLRNDLYCVEWDIKLYSLTHSPVVLHHHK